MKGSLRPSKMVMGIASLVLSTGLFAQATTGNVFDPVTGLLVGTTNAVNDTLLPTMKHGPDYLISDKYNGDIKFMDGVKKGKLLALKVMHGSIPIGIKEIKLPI